MRNEFIEALTSEALTDSRILLLTSDLGYGVIESFQEKVPNQFFNLGIAEQSAISIAAGFASKGFRPFVYSIANFPTFRAMEQIRNDINYMDLPVTIVALGEGLSYGTAGYSHHLIEDISSIRAFGGISIYSPTATDEVIRLGKAPTESLGSELPSPISGGRKYADGSGGLIVFHGGILGQILDAKKILAKVGINPMIYSCFDFQVKNIIEVLSYNSNIPIMVVEEHILAGGLGSMFLEVANEISHVGKIKRVGISRIDKNVVGDQSFLRKHHGLDAASIANAYLELVSF
jgi:transketolase